MIPRRPFFHILEFQEDFGYMGEFEVHTRSWIDEDDGRLGATLYHAFIEIPQANGPKLELDVTRWALQYPERLRKYNEEILAAYLSARDADWEAS